MEALIEVARVAACIHVQQVAGAGYSYRLAGSLAARAGGEIPARRSTFQTVECAKPVAPATSRGPSRSGGGRRRSPPQAPPRAGAASGAAGSSGSDRHDSVRRASASASSQRCHQRCAVADDTLNAAAAAFSDKPPSTARTSAPISARSVGRPSSRFCRARAGSPDACSCRPRTTARRDDRGASFR
jgi:hypothetical protein